jgi:hypothetical protein
VGKITQKTVCKQIYIQYYHSVSQLSSLHPYQVETQLYNFYASRNIWPESFKQREYSVVIYLDVSKAHDTIRINCIHPRYKTPCFFFFLNHNLRVENLELKWKDIFHSGNQYEKVFSGFCPVPVTMPDLHSKHIQTIRKINNIAGCR